MIRWERTHNGLTRYYQAWATCDLFGELVLTRSWGRRGARLGGAQHTVLTNQTDYLAHIEAIEKRRIKRGYTRVTTNQ